MYKLALTMIIIIGCIFQNVQAQLISITPDELEFREVTVDSVAELEFTIENLAEEEYVIATVFSDNPANFSLSWTGERAEAVKTMDILRQIYSGVIGYHQDFGEDPSTVEDLVNEGYTELPEFIHQRWMLRLIGSNPVTQIEAISLDEMPYGPGHAIVFDVGTGIYFGFGTPIGDPQEPLRVMEEMDCLDTAIMQYTQDYQEEPGSVGNLLDNEYLVIPPSLLRNWNFALVGENPISGINAVSTAEMADGAGLTIRYDLASQQFSGHRIPYREFHDWLWRRGDLGRASQENLTLSVSFRPGEVTQYSSEITIVISQPNIAETDTFHLQINGRAVLSAPKASENVPVEFSLFSAYPNPFNSTTTISYELPYSGDVSLQLYNPLGQQLGTLFEGNRQAGIHSVNLIGRDLASGLYFVRLEGMKQVVTRKVMLVR